MERMTTLSKGENTGLPTTTVRAVLSWGAGSPVDVDASALLLTAAGVVRSDADFIFYNQPSHSGSSVRHLGKQGTADALEIDLNRIEPDIERIVLAASADGGTFGQVPQLRLAVQDAGNGASLADFAMQAAAETAFVSGELYRRNGQWKFRAVGQGYSSGLAGLATDFGISVDGDPAPAAPAAATGQANAAAFSHPQSSATSPGQPAPTGSTPTPFTPATAAPAAPTNPTPTGPASTPWGTSPNVSYAPPPAPVDPATAWGPPRSGQAASPWATPTPVAPAPAAAQPPPAPAAQNPWLPPSAGQQPPAPWSQPAPAGPPVANLDRGRVSLRKNDRVSLVKTGEPPLSRIMMGLGWDPARGRKNIDLDASVLAFDPQLQLLDLAWFSHKKAFGGAITHTGDNLTGQGDGDDEQILLELSAVPPTVAHLLFTITSYRGQKFTDIANAFCRLVDGGSGAELVRYDLSESQPSTGVLMAVLNRTGPSWEMRALGEFHNGKTAKDMIRPAAELLSRR